MIQIIATIAWIFGVVCALATICLVAFDISAEIKKREATNGR